MDDQQQATSTLAAIGKQARGQQGTGGQIERGLRFLRDLSQSGQPFRVCQRRQIDHLKGNRCFGGGVMLLPRPIDKLKAQPQGIMVV